MRRSSGSCSRRLAASCACPCPRTRCCSGTRTTGSWSSTEHEAEYSQLVLNMVKLHGRPIRVSNAGTNVDATSVGSGRNKIDIGANLFVGNLSPEVDDKTLHDTFSAFGRLIGNAHVAKDDGTGKSLSYGFVQYSTFEASDLAIQSMDGQFLCGRMITVQYAFKKDASKKGERERHGTAAERLLAAANPNARATFTPHTKFSSGPNMIPLGGGGPQSFVGGGLPPPSASAAPASFGRHPKRHANADGNAWNDASRWHDDEPPGAASHDDAWR